MKWPTWLAGGVKKITARYDAAGMGRRMRGFNPPASGPNRAIEGLQNIRNRARDITRNDWSGESGIQKWVTNLVGVGIVPRLPRDTRKARYTDLWDNWVKVSDADGVLNYYAQEALAVRSWLEAGEVFIRFRPRSDTLGLPVPMQVQLIEAEYVPLLDADYGYDLPAGNKIRSGIELNRYGRRVAYWVYREHPGDRDSAVEQSLLLRIPADQISHMYQPMRPGQLRGVSIAASVIARLRNIENFDDAVLTRQMIANLFALFITRPAAGPDEVSVDPLTGMPYEMVADKAVAALQPGVSHELAPGEDVKFANPPEAGTTYSEFMRTGHLGTAAGFGLPYEIFSGDIKDVSDRTLRVVINEFRRNAEQRQWHNIIPMMCERTREQWVTAGLLSGAITLADAEYARKVAWSPHGWEYIHPVQDVQGKQMQYDLGTLSKSAIISARGDDPDTVFDERAADKLAEQERDLVPPVVPQVDPAQQKQMKAFQARLDTMAAAPAAPAAPTINVHAHLPQTSVNVEATRVDVNVEPPVTHVAAPNVTIEPAVTNVAAPNVTVEPVRVEVTNNVPPAEVTVNLPDRHTTSAIERDSAGNIVNVTQTETTLQ